MEQNGQKWGILLWIFAEGREIGGVYCSVIGHPLRVGATGQQSKAQEWCKGCGWGWKCGKAGTFVGGILLERLEVAEEGGEKL